MVRRTKTRKSKARKTRKPGRKTKLSRQVFKPNVFKVTCNMTTANCTTGASSGAAVSQQADSWIFSTNATDNINYYSMSSMFTLNMIQNYTRFTNVYDMYKILKVGIKITPYSTAALLQTGSSGGFHNQQLALILHSAIDYDDRGSVAPSAAGIDSLRNKVTYRSRNFFSNGRSQYFSLRPRVSMDVFGGTTVPSYGSSAVIKPPWLDCDSYNVNHYGHKWIVECFNPDITTPAYIWFKYEVTLWLEFKQPV